jgi:hypothetical protein
MKKRQNYRYAEKTQISLGLQNYWLEQHAILGAELQ